MTILKLMLVVYLILVMSDNVVNMTKCHSHQEKSNECSNCSYQNTVTRKRKKIIMAATIALLNHKHTKTDITRFGVTSSCYRRWSETVRNLSTEMALMVRNDLQGKKDKKKMKLPLKLIRTTEISKLLLSFHPVVC